MDRHRGKCLFGRGVRPRPDVFTGLAFMPSSNEEKAITTGIMGPPVIFTFIIEASRPFREPAVLQLV